MKPIPAFVDVEGGLEFTESSGIVFGVPRVRFIRKLLRFGSEFCTFDVTAPVLFSRVRFP